MRNIFNTIALYAILFVAGACANEEPASLPNGTIRFAIGQATETGDKTETRATPSELGKPLADRFTLTIMRQGNAQPKYEGPFVESMDLPIGDYSITARCGEDVPIGRDTPYYTGTAQTTIEKDKATSVVIPCRVANALVSVHFGRNAEEKARFDKLYTDYGVKVKVGAYSMDITPGREASSIYFPAGSSPVLSFYGCLRNDNNKRVSFDLTSEALPTTFARAEHAMVTLHLPDPETASVIEISTVEVETVGMEETIPFPWLPIPRVQPVHNYDGNGCLQGTDITFTNSYPGMTWKAEVTDAQNTLYRTIEGTGDLFSSFSANADGWAYIPAGEYTATFYLVQQDKVTQTATRTFTVANPDLKVTTHCHTSYSLYQDGDVTGANACDPYTIYAQAVSINISPSLWQDPKYTTSFDATLAGEQMSDGDMHAEDNGIVVSFGNRQGLSPSFDGYSMSASATFDKVTGTGSKTVYITGLPAEFAPPTKEAWTGHGTVTWESGEVRLGKNTVSQPQYITTDRFAVPAGVKIKAPYSVMMHGATVATTLTVSFGAHEYFKEKSSGGAFNSKDHFYEDVAVFTTTEATTTAKANNSYGSGQTCSRVYYLKYYYAE